MSDIEDLCMPVIPKEEDEIVIKKSEFIKKNHLVPKEEDTKKIINEFLESNLKHEDFDETFRALKNKYRVNPSKGDIRQIFNKYYKDQNVSLAFRKWMIKKAMRSYSGVLVATIVTSPEGFSCKYDCAYCPDETDLNGNKTQPKSYLSNEPAMLRATQNNFDIRLQFWDRIKSYINQGNIIKDSSNSYKMEVIISGGTWDSYSFEYRSKVMNEVYWGANTFDNDRPIKSLEEEITENETSKYRVIGLTIETRPDNINAENIKQYRKWNITRIQLGVQHYDDYILKKLNRKCYTIDTINAIRLLKQVGLKVVCHLMPDLPGSSPEKDNWMFTQLLTRPELMCDDLKIYPTAVIQPFDDKHLVKSKITDWYNAGSYIPYSEKCFNDLIEVLINFKRKIYPWIRIQRLVRDIPKKSIQAGYNQMSNLRQYILDIMGKRNQQCYCIRCMEIGDKDVNDCDIILVVRKYEANDGIEYHLSIESHKMNSWDWIYYFLCLLYAFVYENITGKEMFFSGNLNSYHGLYGFLRLRFDPNPGGNIIPEINNCALVRELHVYGQSLGIGRDGVGSQHCGYGKKLMEIGETISAMNGFNKVAVIAGVGVREYYKNKCGYYLGETYMLKDIPKYNFKIIKRFVIMSVLTAIVIQTCLKYFVYY